MAYLRGTFIPRTWRYIASVKGWRTVIKSGRGFMATTTAKIFYLFR